MVCCVPSSNNCTGQRPESIVSRLEVQFKCDNEGHCGVAYLLELFLPIPGCGSKYDKCILIIDLHGDLWHEREP